MEGPVEDVAASEMDQPGASSMPTTPPPDVVADPVTGLKVVIIGCCHGELDAMYDSILYIQQKQNIKIDLAVRNMTDLNSLACPQQHRRINTFHKYYSGEKVAPVTTVFIGGNHEASNHLTELYYGGWVAPNIYFLGMSGVVNFGGLRIGGLSGIYKQYDYKRGHYEMPPYTNDTMRSVYHIREFEVFKLMQLTQRLDVMLSHDWPRGIAYHGDKERLLRAKSFLRQELESGVFGSPPAEQLLFALQPEYWFAAHMHVKFPAVVHHPGGQMTKFLALDKVMPNRDFLQVWEFPQAKGPKGLTYDEEWLAIVKSTNHMLSFSRNHVHMPSPSNPSQRFDYRPTEEEREWIRKRVQEKAEDGWRVPNNFARTAPAYNPAERGRGQAGALFESPQRKAYLDLLDLPDLFLAHAASSSSSSFSSSSSSAMRPSFDSRPPAGVIVPEPPLLLPSPPHHHHVHHQTGHHLQPPLPMLSNLPGLVLPPPARTATAQLLFPSLLTGSTKNEEEIELSLDDDDEGDGDGGEEAEAKKRKIGSQREKNEGGEEVREEEVVLLHDVAGE